MSKAERAAAEADRILTFLHLCEEDRHPIAVPVRAMDGAVPLALADARAESAPEVLIPVNDGAPAIWPIDVAVVQDANAGVDDPADRWPAGTLQFQRLRTITTKEARSFGASRFAPRMVMDEVVCAKPDGTTTSAKAPLAFIGGRWVNAAPKRIVGGPPNLAERTALGLGYALMLRYEWTVWIGYGQGPRVRFLSDPLGAREVFRLRDLPPGRDRRAALRHWVSAHTRTKRDDPESRTWVRKHLRGATDFTWNGMRCRIQPAEFEMEQQCPVVRVNTPASEP